MRVPQGTVRFLRRLWRPMLSALLLAALLWGGAVAYRLAGVYRHGRQTQAGARATWQSRDASGIPDRQDLRSLRMGLERLERDLTGLRGLLRPPACLLSAQSLWPLAGDYGRLVCDGLDLAVTLAASAWWGALEMESATEQFGQTNLAAGTPVEMRADPLAQSLSRLARHRQQLEALRPAARRLSQVALTLPGLPDRARSAGSLASLAVEGLLLAPEALGGTEERCFLVIVQNSDELRPTGGFISSVVVVRMQSARLVSLEYMNSYDVETERFMMPAAPGPLGTYMGLGGLVFRDANWSPDFPTSAQVLASLYQSSRGEAVDAVFAIDTQFLQGLLGALGPVPVPEYGVTITAENLLSTAEAFWEDPVEGTALAEREMDFMGWLQHRKDFGWAFIQAGLAHLQQLPPDGWVSLAKSLEQSLQQKHLQIWSLTSEALRRDLTHNGWSGSVGGAPGDFLMVVDANLGYNKVDRNIERSITYTLSAETDQPSAVLSLTYRNRAQASLAPCANAPQVLDSYAALTEQCYWDYVRALVPRGAVLLDVQGTETPVDVGMEGGRTSFGTLIVVPPGTSHTLTLSYSLPPEIMRCEGALCHYALTVQKQSGTDAVPLTLYSDAEPLNLVAPGWQPAAGWPLSTTLQRDRSVTWAIRPGD